MGSKLDVGRVPNNNQPFLSDIPLDPSNWNRLRSALVDMKSAIQGLVQNPDPPDQVTNLTVTSKPTGVLLNWNAVNRATDYVIYRAYNTSDFKQAASVGGVRRSNNLGFFDPAGQQSGVTTRTYWVQARNGQTLGPVSASVTISEPLVTGGLANSALGIPPLLLKNQTRQGVVAPIGLPSSATPTSTDTTAMTVTFASAPGWATGERCTVSASGGGLSTGVTYYLHLVSSTVFSFHLTVDDAVAGANKVTLTAPIVATINPDALAIASFPNSAYAEAMATFRNLGTAGNWRISTNNKGVGATNYSILLGPGDPVLNILGEGFVEENPPLGDIVVYHDNPAAGGAGSLSFYVGWNDGTSPVVGPTGPAGSKWYWGSGVPSALVGITGDLYLNVANGDVYQKTAGGWGSPIGNLQGPQGIQGIQGIQGLTGATGQYGGAITMDFLFDNGVSNADPGAGKFRLNNATENTATAMYVDKTSQDSVALGTVLQNLCNSTSQNKAMVRIIKKTDQTKFLIFYITGNTDHTGYEEFAMTLIASSAASPFSNGDECLLCVDQIGDQGTAGGMVLLSKQILLADAAFINFPSINQTYSHLLLVINARSVAASADDYVYIQFNGDTTANYDFQHTLVTNNATSFASGMAQTTGIRVGDLAAATAARSTQIGMTEVLIPAYSLTTFEKLAKGKAFACYGTGAGSVDTLENGGGWRSTAAITSVKVLTSAANLKAGSGAWLYGIP